MTAPRSRILAILKRHGWNSTSFQAVENDFGYWFGQDDESAVAYFDTGRAWVVAGSPIAARHCIGQAASQFLSEARQQRKRVLFFAVEPRFLEATGYRSLIIGEQSSWDPRRWTARHRGHRSFKEQLRRARARGLRVERVDSDVAAGALRVRLERLMMRWLESRVMPPMRFLVALDPFLLAEERRYYIARVGEEIQGMLVAVPIYDRGGWFFEHILRDPQAPNGTTESLINLAMLEVAADGCTFVTLGLAPLAGKATWLRRVRRVTRSLYDFEGLYRFKAKLRPDSWTPIYLAWPDRRAGPGAIYDVLDAFAGGRLFHFAIRSILRAPSPVLLALAFFLIPWAATLSAVETARWFPSRRIQRAWVTFDLLMAAALLALSQRWRPRLAVSLCLAAATDGVLTAVQVRKYNLPRARRLSEIAISAVAIAAPFGLALFMAGALRARAVKG